MWTRVLRGKWISDTVLIMIGSMLGHAEGLARYVRVGNSAKCQGRLVATPHIRTLKMIGNGPTHKGIAGWQQHHA